MGSPDDDEQAIFKQFHSLCTDLNMDKEATEDAWIRYESAAKNYSLEGDQLHWLACASYVACRFATPSTVAESSQLVEGNLVSLTRLLRQCKMSFVQFINKLKKWADMTQLPPDFINRIERLQSNFAVSAEIFKKFQPIFLDMFVTPNFGENQKHTRPKKLRNIPCNSARLFEFTWTLFIAIKSQVPNVSDELVDSYHLLLACCDYIYRNVILSDRRDLLKTRFSGYPNNIDDTPVDPECIIDHLCQKHDGISIEAKSTKEYCWKKYVKKLFEKKALKGNIEELSQILEVQHFDYNLKAVNRVYEEYVLSVGDFDERIFLGEEAESVIGAKTIGNWDFNEQVKAKREIINQLNNIQRVTLPTPLTGRNYLCSRESNNPTITPVSTATQSITRLHNIISARNGYPSKGLLDIITMCDVNPQIEERVENMVDIFCTKYATARDIQGSPDDFAKNRASLATCLFYKLLEDILTDEMKKPNFNCNNLMSQPIFFQTLFACCLEIVMYSYDSQRTFPWVLEAMEIEPYHFYKIIEIIVRAEDQLSRDMVKHLNRIEEQILESLAWRSGSALWFALQSVHPIPSCEDVSLPQQLFHDTDVDNNNLAPNTTPGVKNYVGKSTAIRKINTGVSGPSTTPVPSVSERFQSPVNLPGGIYKKKLFLESPNTSLRTVKPGESLLQKSKSVVQQVIVNSNNGNQPQANTNSVSTINGNTNVTGLPQLPQLVATKYIPVKDLEERYIPITRNSPSPGNILITKPTTSQSLLSRVNNSNANGITVSSVSNSVEVVSSSNENNASIDINSSSSNDGITIKDNKENKKPKITGSLGLFFRKFYHLAAVRMQELCNQLNLTEIDVRRKIWTCIENTIVKHTDLMLNRHLDQILMCSVYVICKIVNKDRTFTDVMRCYRLQPQCTSHVYRHVLLKSNNQPLPNSSQDSNQSNKLSDGNDHNEQRGDLIEFYNTVFVKKVQQYVMGFNNRSSQPNDKLTLSPLPIGKSTPISPRRRISDKHPVYVRSLIASEKSSPVPSEKCLAYCFSRSPAKDLRAINTMIQNEYGPKIGKRLINDDNEFEPCTKKSLVTRKVQGLVVDRLAAKTSLDS